MKLTPGMLYMAHHDDPVYAYYVERKGIGRRITYKLFAVQLRTDEPKLLAEGLTKEATIGYLKLLNVLNGRETWHT